MLTIEQGVAGCHAVCLLVCEDGVGFPAALTESGRLNPEAAKVYDVALVCYGVMRTVYGFAGVRYQSQDGTGRGARTGSLCT
ncbi:hypothetical protein GCM10009104_23420 [Marinobacterium maritimum]|uniref:Uncharacterized protein n=1 Tax=Marinobacterium maritimum TaxID=500162 RepID=A0ABN1I7Q0_9GAMM